ncbi:hypothetical protein [Amycolatopsis sp. FDAARGOS 1241]|uniref:hypothetical protein n=1 Tax=Amycolatopsis sp. FDAARGOS 1241 TaxID=2778070 RepID=UPI0019503364|nr:hypothetical protein [Amycolatopsis sp. FDAARGOS 1241]QRP46984.1 hypothetical protein I6J71_02775 [Amycolatopsis sp. FDAARGOS 1241]
MAKIIADGRFAGQPCPHTPALSFPQRKLSRAVGAARPLASAATASAPAGTRRRAAVVPAQPALLDLFAVDEVNPT